MERDFRYKIEHVGDYFADLLEEVVQCAKSSARGVVLTYDIKQLSRKKETLLNNIGLRTTQLSKENSAFTEDGILSELLRQLDEVETKLKALIQEREGLVSSCCCPTVAATTQSAEQHN